MNLFIQKNRIYRGKQTKQEHKTTKVHLLSKHLVVYVFVMVTSLFIALLWENDNLYLYEGT